MASPVANAFIRKFSNSSAAEERHKAKKLYAATDDLTNSRKHVAANLLNAKRRSTTRLWLPLRRSGPQPPHRRH